MNPAKAPPRTVDAYIAGFPKDVQAVLRRVRTTIMAATPKAQGAISYGIPAFKLNDRYFVSFAGWKKHVSVYPVPAGDAAFRKKIAGYQGGRGTLRFPLDEPIPYALIARAAKLLARERAATPRIARKRR